MFLPLMRLRNALRDAEREHDEAVFKERYHDASEHRVRINSFAKAIRILDAANEAMKSWTNTNP